jgi:hypothetical protein
MPDLNRLKFAVNDHGRVNPLDHNELEMDDGACPTVEQRTGVTSRRRSERDDLDNLERWLDEGGR